MNIIDNTKKSEEIEKIEDICRRESLNSDSVIYDESKNKINLVYGSKEDIHATIEYDDEQKKIKFRETENVPFITMNCNCGSKDCRKVLEYKLFNK